MRGAPETTRQRRKGEGNEIDAEGGRADSGRSNIVSASCSMSEQALFEAIKRAATPRTALMSIANYGDGAVLSDCFAGDSNTLAACHTYSAIEGKKQQDRSRSKCRGKDDQGLQNFMATGKYMDGRGL